MRKIEMCACNIHVVLKIWQIYIYIFFLRGFNYLPPTLQLLPPNLYTAEVMRKEKLLLRRQILCVFKICTVRGM